MIKNRQEAIKNIEIENMEKIGKTSPYAFEVGDTIKVYFKIIEGNRKRIQVFEGVVIRKRGAGLGKTFTVRKISYNIGVERIFPMYSPKIEKVEVVWKGKVRRAKLYYLRNKKGKAAQVKRRKEHHLRSGKAKSGKQESGKQSSKKEG